MGLYATLPLPGPLGAAMPIHGPRLRGGLIDALITAGVMLLVYTFALAVVAGIWAVYLTWLAGAAIVRYLRR